MQTTIDYKRDEPPEGTLVRLLKNSPMGFKTGQVGRIVTDHSTYRTRIEFDAPAKPHSSWTTCTVLRGEYEILQVLKKKKLKLRSGTAKAAKIFKFKRKIKEE